jgi:hypothetical protein
MTVVADLVTDAAYAAQVIGQDQTLSSGDAQLILRILNRMLDSASNEKQMIFLNDEETFTTVAGQQAYTTALLTGGRPVSINSMRLSLNGIDYPVDQIDQLKWNAIPVKNINAIPTWFYYDGAMPNASMFFYPIPYAAFTAHIYCQRILTGTLTLASTVTLPPGYEAWIVAALAVAIWPSFKGGDPSKTLITQMIQAKSVIKRNNFQPLEMAVPFDSSPGDVSNGFPYPFW